jgi:hypothetical protein
MGALAMQVQYKFGEGRGLHPDFVHRRSTANAAVVISYCVFCGELIAAAPKIMKLDVAEKAHRCRGGFHIGKLHLLK